MGPRAFLAIRQAIAIRIGHAGVCLLWVDGTVAVNILSAIHQSIVITVGIQRIGSGDPFFRVGQAVTINVSVVWR